MTTSRLATISEVAQLCGVHRDTIKSWTTKFAEHFTLSAKPPKGQERQFTEADLRVLALIADHWEEESTDWEHIRAMLNCGEHHHEERFVQFARLHSPVFQDVPDEIDETWQHGALIGGMAMHDWIQVARSYKMAADELVKQALAQFEPREIDYPIFFLYRHSIELYLKAMLQMLKVNPPTHHYIANLVGELDKRVGSKLGGWIKDRLMDFDRIDKKSNMFRYPDSPDPKSLELWVCLDQLRVVMDNLTKAFDGHIATMAKREPLTSSDG